MKTWNNDVFFNANRDDQFSQKTKTDENFEKKNYNWRMIFLYANERIYISSKRLRNALFKQNHDDFYAEHFEYKKNFWINTSKVLITWFNSKCQEKFWVLHQLSSNQVCKT